MQHFATQTNNRAASNSTSASDSAKHYNSVGTQISVVQITQSVQTCEPEKLAKQTQTHTQNYYTISQIETELANATKEIERTNWEYPGRRYFIEVVKGNYTPTDVKLEVFYNTDFKDQLPVEPFKTLTEESLREVCDEDIVVYIGNCRIASDHTGDTLKYKLYR